MARHKSVSLAATGVLAILLTAASVAWACTSSSADMTLSNATATTWDPDTNCDGTAGTGGKGCNFSTCPLTQSDCTRPVNVTGKGFENTDMTSGTTTPISSVDLYFVNTALLLTGVGGNAERLGTLCRQGTLLASGVPVTSATFGPVSVTLPPTAADHAYGADAVCAVWVHTHTLPGGITDTHDSGLGNQYNITPV
ncbi:MAG: hypothetical protein ABR564_06480 [Candidatus Dormibacteria bacterium]